MSSGAPREFQLLGMIRIDASQLQVGPVFGQLSMKLSIAFRGQDSSLTFGSGGRLGGVNTQCICHFAQVGLA